jgi:biopolymer transport protein ExbD
MAIIFVWFGGNEVNLIAVTAVFFAIFLLFVVSFFVHTERWAVTLKTALGQASEEISYVLKNFQSASENLMRKANSSVAQSATKNENRENAEQNDVLFVNKDGAISKDLDTNAIRRKPIDYFFSAPRAAQSKISDDNPNQTRVGVSQTEAAPKSSLDVALSAAMKEYALTPPKSTKDALHKWGLLGLVVGIAGWLGGSIASFVLVQSMTSNSGSLFSSAYDGSLTTLATFATIARASFFIGVIGGLLLFASLFVVENAELK